MFSFSSAFLIGAVAARTSRSCCWPPGPSLPPPGVVDGALRWVDTF